MKRCGQATIEFALIFVIMAVFILGLLGLWKWSSDNIVKRQVNYNSTRVQAGSSSPGEPSGGAMFEPRSPTNRDTYMFR